MTIYQGIYKIITAAAFPLAVLAVIMWTTPDNAVSSESFQYGKRIRTLGALVPVDQAGKNHVYELFSGDHVLYYKINQVFYKENWSFFHRLPFNRIQVLSSEAEFQQLTRLGTCELIELDMTVYNLTSSAAFLKVDKPADGSWTEADISSQPCKDVCINR